LALKLLGYHTYSKEDDRVSKFVSYFIVYNIVNKFCYGLSHDNYFCIFIIFIIYILNIFYIILLIHPRTPNTIQLHLYISMFLYDLSILSKLELP
jgi:hypothetical protein